MCSDNGRGSGSFPSWGRRRRRREIDEELEAVESNQHSVTVDNQESEVKSDTQSPNIVDKEEVRKMLGVLPSRAEAEALRKALRKERELNMFNEYLQSKEKPATDPQQLRPKMSASRLNDDGQPPTIHKMDAVCVTQVHYYSLLVTLILLIIWLGLAIAYFILHTRRKIEKIKVASMVNLVQQSTDSRPTDSRPNSGKTSGKSIRETIYSDVSMVERPRSLSEHNYGSVLMNIY